MEREREGCSKTVIEVERERGWRTGNDGGEITTGIMIEKKWGTERGILRGGEGCSWQIFTFGLIGL